MDVTYHRGLKRDLRAALAFYDTEGGPKLGDRFFAEVQAAVELVLANPKRFHWIDDGFRRAGLPSFPYHFIFEENEKIIRFLVLRHDKRHPQFGLRRR